MPRAAPAGRGRGEAGCRVVVASRRVSPPVGRAPPPAGTRAASKGRGSPGGERGRGPTREGRPPSGPGRVDCPGGWGPSAVPEPNRGGDGAVGGGGLRDRRAPGARSSPAPGGVGAPCSSVPAVQSRACRAVPCRARRGRGGVAPRPPPPESSRWEPRWRLLNSGRGEHGAARARLPCVCWGALRQKVPAARGRWRVRSGRSQRVARRRRWGLGSSGSSLPSGVCASRGTLAALSERGRCGGRRCSALPSLQPKVLRLEKEKQIGLSMFEPK